MVVDEHDPGGVWDGHAAIFTDAARGSYGGYPSSFAWSTPISSNRPGGERRSRIVRRSGLDESAADRVAGECDPIAHAELAQNVRAVALDRLLADREQLSDLA